METYIYLIIGLAVGAALGWLLGSRGKQTGAVSEALLRSETERALRAESEVEKMRETARLEAEQEAKLLAEIAPLKQNLTTMATKIETLEKERTEQFTTITEQIRNQQALDAQLRNTTAVLANALSNNQTRGGWGEIRLEEIIQAAGLVKGTHFEMQVDAVNHDGKAIRPDCVVYLPQNATVAIDSKAPMANYLKALAERERGVDANKDLVKKYMKDYIADFKKHIKDLGEKDYWSGLTNSPELTLLFVPTDPVLAATLDEENLIEYAFHHRVALVSPTSLFSVLKTVAYTWRQSADEAVIHEIIDLGVALYREVRIIGEKYDKLGGHIDAVVDDYNKLLSNLDKSFLTPTRKLNDSSQKRLGLNDIPEPRTLEDRTKRASSPEMTEGKNKEIEGK